jgi:pimeloyl-ACP methyl ester carboxylesterase
MKKLTGLIFMIVSLAGNGQSKAFHDFEKSTIKINKEKFVLYKGIVHVRLDRSDSSSKFIDIPVHVIKSPSQNPLEPVYWLEGGPGQSNMNFKPSKGLLLTHDFVLVGYRGVDGPVMMRSKKLIKAFRGADNHLFGDKSLDNLEKAFKQYFEDLAKKGIDINHYTIVDVIDDLEDVRKYLGHQKINLYSASYGTRVALLYSYRYPAAIKRSLMVGVNPQGHFVWYPEMTTRIIRTYDSIYRAQGNKLDISIEESIKLSFKNMPKRWSFFRLDPDKIKTTTFCLLFSKNSAVMAFDAYRRAALKHDYSGLYLMQLAYNYLDNFMPINYGDLFCKAFSADYNPDFNYRQNLKPDSFEIGAPLSFLYWGISNKFNMRLIDSEYRKPRISNTETLMIGGDLDISTPAEFATKELMSYLPNSKQIILKHMAHCGDLMWLEQNAYNNTVTRFFNEGLVDTSKFTNHPVDLKPKRSFNKMAKWLYPFVFVMSLIK